MKWNFAQNRKVDDINKVPENLRVFYEEVDDGHVLKSTPEVTAAVSVITGQDNALRAVRKEADEAKKNSGADLTELSEYGTTVGDIKKNVEAKITELTEASKGTESLRAQIETVRREAKEANAKALAEKDNEIQAANAQLDEYIITNEIQSAASKVTGLNAKLVAPFVRNQLGFEIEEGEGGKKMKRLVVKGQDGAVRYSRNSETAGERMSVAELLSEMSEDEEYAGLFPSKAKKGSGVPNAGPVQPGISRRPDKVAEMSSHDKIAEGLRQRQK